MRGAVRLALAGLVMGCGGGPSLSVAIGAQGTVLGEPTSVSARAAACPSGAGWLIEGSTAEVGALIWLPADTPGQYRVARGSAALEARVVLLAVTPRDLETWRADSGQVTLERTRDEWRGAFVVQADTLEAVGAFTLHAREPDSTACAIPLESIPGAQPTDTLHAGG